MFRILLMSIILFILSTVSAFAANRVEVMDYIINNWVALTAVIGSIIMAVSAQICSMTDTPLPDWANKNNLQKAWAILYKVFEFFARNNAKAKQK